MFPDRSKRDCMNIKLISIEDGVCSLEVLNSTSVRIIKLFDWILLLRRRR